MQRIALDFASRTFPTTQHNAENVRESPRAGKGTILGTPKLMPMAGSQPDENSTFYLLRLEYKPSFHFSLLLQIYANTLTNSAAHLRGEGFATDAPQKERERP